MLVLNTHHILKKKKTIVIFSYTCYKAVLQFAVRFFGFWQQNAESEIQENYIYK